MFVPISILYETTYGSHQAACTKTFCMTGEAVKWSLGLEMQWLVGLGRCNFRFPNGRLIAHEP